MIQGLTADVEISTLTQVNRGPTFALRRSTLDLCLGGQRSVRAMQRAKGAVLASTPTCTSAAQCLSTRESEVFIDNLLVRNLRIIIVMIRWTGLVPWEFEFLFPGSLTSTFQVSSDNHRQGRDHLGAPGAALSLIEMIWLSGLASWEFEFPFQVTLHLPSK